MFQIYLMPERKVKGSHDKWIEHEIVESKNRKSVTEQLHKSHKNGTWKVRKV